jgi:hypothetical protein
MNGCDGIVERRDKPLSLQEFCNKDATGLDIMGKLVCLKLGDGNFERGFTGIVASPLPDTGRKRKMYRTLCEKRYITTSELPTFWFYVPYSAALPGEFVLQEEADRTVNQTSLTLSGTPGVVSLSLPPTAEPLEIDKRYHWYFTVNCDSETIAFVHGWIQRTELNPALTIQL